MLAPLTLCLLASSQVSCGFDEFWATGLRHFRFSVASLFNSVLEEKQFDGDDDDDDDDDDGDSHIRCSRYIHSWFCIRLRVVVTVIFVELGQIIFSLLIFFLSVCIFVVVVDYKLFSFARKKTTTTAKKFKKNNFSSTNTRIPIIIWVYLTWAEDEDANFTAHTNIHTHTNTKT